MTSSRTSQSFSGDDDTETTPRSSPVAEVGEESSAI